MAHAQKPNFVFRRNGRVHLNRLERQFSRGVRIKGRNAGYTVLRGSVKSTGYPLHSPVTPSLPLPYVTVCHYFSTGLYILDVVCSPNLSKRSVLTAPPCPGILPYITISSASFYMAQISRNPKLAQLR